MLVQVRPNGLDDVPLLKVNVDQPRAGALGLNLADVNDTLSTALGGAYVNDFLDRGRIKKVFVQADESARSSPEDIGRLYARSANGAMAPFSAFSDSNWSYGAARLERYNGRSSVEILGAPAPGYSTGAAMARMEELGNNFRQALQSSGPASPTRRSCRAATPALTRLSILIVFLSLAALYESWSVPIAVILVVPLGVVGALIAAWLTGLNNDLQVGLIATVGVAAKNAILIVEFAEEKMREGLCASQAADEAKLRLRPILMTSLAFTFGVLPLAVSNGAGAGGRMPSGEAWSVE
jgi:HAE1 family hydrophobic/amphiphilic exporter-1/multidrug efflux pump